jgi:hypothetical protein
MERELWKLLCHLAKVLYNGWPHGLYSDDEIVAVYAWAVVHDRPICWACDPAHWPADLRGWELPSQPTMSRRLRSATVASLLELVEEHLLTLSAVGACWVRVIDAKALPVGGPSRDPDAQWGRGACGIQHGYKFHAIWGVGPLPIAWGLAGLNVSEKRMARLLIGGGLPGEGYLLGDSQFDSNELYNAAAQQGYQLVAARQRPNTQLGHRRHSPHRLRSMALLQKPFGKALYRTRFSIEHCFAGLTTFVGGLGPLPFWVRRFHRVRLWLQTKILLNALRILRRTNPNLLPAVE